MSPAERDEEILEIEGHEVRITSPSKAFFCVPEGLLGAGFEFEVPDLRSALDDLLGR